MKPESRIRRVGRAALWLSYPVYGPFARGWRLFRTGTGLIRNVGEIMTGGKAAPEDSINIDNSRRARQRYKTRNYGV